MRTPLLIFAILGISIFPAAAQQPSPPSTPAAQAHTRQGTRPTPQMGMGILALESDTAGRLFVDGSEKLALSPGTISPLKLTAGQHFIELRNASGTKLWQEIVDVPADRQVAKHIEAGRKQEPVRPPPAPELEEWQELSLLNRIAASGSCSLDRKCDGVLDTQAEQLQKYCVESPSAGRPEAPSVQTGGPPSEAIGALQVRIDRINRKLAAMNETSCAEVLYDRGEFGRALGKIGPVIEDMERFKATPETWQSVEIAKAYALRGLIENALLDRKAALADLGTALDYFSANRKEIGDVAVSGVPQISAKAAQLLRMPDVFMMQAHLYRAFVLYRMGRFAEALADYNSYAAISTTIGAEDVVAHKFGEIIRRHVQEQGANNDGSTTASEAIPDAAARHGSPNIHPSVASAGETDIRSEIDAIANAGLYSPLPDDHIGMASRSNSTTATRIIRNDTSYTLHLLMSGPVDRRIDLPVGGSTAIEFPPGSYRVAARVDSSNVHPFYGVQVLEVGIEYTSQFYIK